MPRVPAFRISAVADLLRQLEYAPPETRKRHMDAAERLIADLDPAQAYPEEFIVFRITGYRSDRVAEPATFVGAALQADLANLLQRLSAQLELPPSRQHDGGWAAALPLEEVAARLNVSAKTVQRYRTQGLVCHVVTFDDDEKRLACFEDALQRFVTARRQHVEKAATFTRISDDTEALIISEATALRRTQRLSLNAAAAVLARKHGRALETIRQMLRRHDRASAEPIFHERGPLQQRDVRLIHRAWLRGIDLAPLAQHFGKSRATVHRVIARRRAELLRTLEIAFVAMPTFKWQDAEAVILSPPIVSRDLRDLPPHDEAIRLLQWAGEQQAIAEDVEDALLGAWNFLKMRAATGIRTLQPDEQSSSDAIDAIETDLRWAALLHRRLVLLALPSAVKRIEFNLGRSLTTQPAEQIIALLRLAVEVVTASLQEVDPGRGQRLERIAAFDMERELARRGVVATTTRAAARHQAGAIPLRNLLENIDPWMKWLDPWSRLRRLTAQLPDASRELLVMRYCWSGEPPRRLTEMAQRLRLKPTSVARRLQKAIRELRAAARAEV